jgi:hypothetical protein
MIIDGPVVYRVLPCRTVHGPPYLGSAFVVINAILIFDDGAHRGQRPSQRS